MKIAILGGSFNPIHVGHLALADAVCCSLKYDKILFVPTYKPPHKTLALSSASSDDRFLMVQEAIRGDERFVAEPCELERGGVSYTWDTVCFLEKKYESVLEGKIGVIFGEDLLGDFDKWENSSLLAQRADLILAVRPREKTCAEKNPQIENVPSSRYGVNPSDWTRDTFPYPHKCVENPRLELSSSEIRRLIACGGAWRYLVSEGVFHYIENGHLYGYRTN